MAKKHPGRRHLPKGLEILYEDDDLLVIDKSAGLLTVGTATDKTRTAQYILTDYVRKGCAKSRNRVFVVHRLDQWTSGVLIFAKSEEIKNCLQDNWKNTEKTYLAVVHGRLKEKQGVITSYLAENSAYTVYSTTDTSKGRLSHTEYKVIKETENFSLVEINLLTGRKNQIRVHLSDKGHPIVGDRKYGLSRALSSGLSRAQSNGRKNDDHKRLALHAKSISFTHPVTGEQMNFTTKTPAYFNDLMK